MNLPKINKVCLLLALVLVCGCSSTSSNTSKEHHTSNDIVLDKTYTTKYNESIEGTYPTFTFSYPSSYKVITEPIANDEEHIVIKDNKGAEVEFYYFNYPSDYNFGGNRLTMIKVDATKVEDANFKPLTINENNYSSLGKFSVTKLKIVGEMDMKEGEEYDPVDGNEVYTLLPNKDIQQRDGVTGMLQLEYSFYYEGFVSFQSNSIGKLTSKQRNTIIKIIKSFKVK